MSHHLKYKVLLENLAVSRLEASAEIPNWATGGALWNLVRTADELSIVCDEVRVPAGVRSEPGWVALKLEGPFPFELTGVLSSFIAPMAEANIPIFAFATFDTDYVLIQRDQLPKARQVLAAAGHCET